MARAIPIVIPPWVTELKDKANKTDQSQTLFHFLGKLMQWRNMLWMQDILLQHAAGSGIHFQLKSLFDTVQEEAVKAGHTHPLMVRIATTAIPKQFLLIFSTAEKNQTLLATYVLRLTDNGRIEGVRMAATLEPR